MMGSHLVLNTASRPAPLYQRVMQGLILCAALLPINAHANKTISICVGNFPPYNSHVLPKNGPIIEIATEAFRRSGYQMQFIYMPWARILKEGEHGQCGILGIWRNPQRDLIFDYAQPIIKQELGFFARSGSQYDLSKPKTLEALSIGVERSSYLPPALANSRLHFDLASSLHTNLLKLSKERIDLAFGNKAAGLYMIKAEKGLQNLEWQTPSLEVKETYLAFAKTHPQKELLLQAFNRGFDSMKADGSYKKILKAAGL
jgi:polar amino acid transport system substrate-binding protein